jgi:hypothetical protein
VASVSAALEVARSGFRTALVEKTIWFGGLATSGYVFICLPLCDGNGQQVIFGIAKDLLQLCLKYGPGEPPDGWGEGDKRERKSRYTISIYFYNG